MMNEVTTDKRQQAVNLTERIRANGRLAVTAVYEIGKDLRTMNREKLFEALGYEKFEEYASKEFNIEKRQAYNYITIYEKLGDDFVQSNAQLGVTKLLSLTQIDRQDREELLKEYDLSGLTTKEVQALVDKIKIQGEQLSMLEEKREAESYDKVDSAEFERVRAELEAEKANSAKMKAKAMLAEMRADAAEKKCEEFANRPIEVAVSEPEIKEVIKEVVKEVPDEKAIAEKDKQIKELMDKIQEKESEAENIKKGYELKIEQMKAEAENVKSADKDNFKSLYADAYKAFSGLVEFIKQSSESKDVYLDKAKKLIEVLNASLEGV